MAEEIITDNGSAELHYSPFKNAPQRQKTKFVMFTIFYDLK
jgi:hypothetical protein